MVQSQGSGPENFVTQSQAAGRRRDVPATSKEQQDSGRQALAAAVVAVNSAGQCRRPLLHGDVGP